MNILLVYANTYPLLWPQPSGLSIIARVAREAGHQVRFVDLMFEKDPHGVLAKALAQAKPDLIGFTLRNLDNADLQSPRSFVAEYVQFVQAATTVAPTIIGGAAVTSAGIPLYQRTGATYAMTGQGERAFPRFLEELARGVTTFTAPGLMWREGSQVRHNPPEFLAHPRGIDWSWIDTAKYRKSFMSYGLITKTGCAHRCSFCDAFNTSGSSFYPREPEVIIEELRRDIAEYRLNRREFMMIDPCFNQPLAWGKRLLEAIIRSGIKIRFSAIIEPTPDLDREYCELLVRAGNTMVTGLVGSCHDEVLAASNRPFRAADIARAFETFEAAHVLYMPQLMFGGPGETRETAEATIAFMRRFSPTMLMAGVGVRVYPHAPIRERAIADGQVTEDNDLLEPVFYLSPQVDAQWLTERVKHVRAPLLRSLGSWGRYLWRLAF